MNRLTRELQHNVPEWREKFAAMDATVVFGGLEITEK
jgi:hypothetical protein